MSQPSPQSTSPPPSEPKPSVPPLQPKITTLHGPISKIQKQIEILQKQIEIERLKKTQQQFKNIQRQKMKVAKLHSFTFNTPYQQQPEIPIDGDLIRGSRLFTSQCTSCHVLDANSYYRNTTGPALGLIYQRRNASDIFFKGYSNQLLKKDFLWSSHKLNMYLKNPKAMVPGTKCNFVKNGLESEEDRVDIITFLRQYTHAMSINLNMKMQRKMSKNYIDTNKQTSKKMDENYRK